MYSCCGGRLVECADLERQPSRTYDSGRADRPRSLYLSGTSSASRTLLLSHLLRAVLFGALAGGISSLLGDAVDGWVLYLGCAALSAAGGWVLARPMERNSLLAVLVLWLVAGFLYYSLGTPVATGPLAVGAGLGEYVELGGVVIGLGIGALLGRAVARP